MGKREEKKILMELVEDNHRAFREEMAELKRRMDAEDEAAIRRHEEWMNENVHGMPRNKKPKLVLLK